MYANMSYVILSWFFVHTHKSSSVQREDSDSIMCPVLTEFAHVCLLCGVLAKHLIQSIGRVRPVGEKFRNHLE